MDRIKEESVPGLQFKCLGNCELFVEIRKTEIQEVKIKYLLDMLSLVC